MVTQSRVVRWEKDRRSRTMHAYNKDGREVGKVVYTKDGKCIGHVRRNRPSPHALLCDNWETRPLSFVEAKSYVNTFAKVPLIKKKRTRR